MAVNINIPSIGTVTASNAAEESTLRAILTAVQQQNRVIRGNESIIEGIQTSQTRNAQTANSNLARIASGASRSASSINSMSKEVSGSFAETQAQVRSLGGYLKNLGASALNASLSIVKHSKSINQSPIEQSIRNVNTLINSAGEGFSAIIGLFGKGKIKGMKDAVAGAKKPGNKGSFSWGEFFGDLGQGTAEGLKYVNEMLGSQLSTTVETFDQFNKLGASFAQGMGEMRFVATSAGVLIDVFARGIQSAEQAVRSLGLSFSASSSSVAKVMEQLGQSTDVAGTRLVEVLRRVGYTQEEQIALSAEYLALMKTTMTTQEFRRFESRQIDSEVAKRTVEYGKNLKLLSDLTGANAQELAREERQRRLSAIALSAMSDKEAETYSTVGSALAKMGVAGQDLEKMILQTSQFGYVADPDLQVMMQSLPELQGRISEIVAIQKNEALSPEESSRMIMGLVGDIGQYAKENARNNDTLAALSRANLAGAANFRLDFVEGLAGINFDSTTIANLQTNQADAAAGVDLLTASLVASEYAIRDITVEVERMSSKALPTYAGFLESVNTKIRDFFEVVFDGMELIGDLSVDEMLSFGNSAKTSTEDMEVGKSQYLQTDGKGRPPSVSEHDIIAKSEMRQRRELEKALAENNKKLDYNELAVALKEVMPAFDFSGLETKVDGLKNSTETKSNELITVMNESKDVLRQIAKSSNSSADSADRSYRSLFS